MVAAATRSGGLFPIRYTALVLCALGGALCLAAALLWQRWWWWLAAALLLALALVGWFDLRQTRHAILRNYPIIGHLRFLFESIRPEMRQYFIESDNENLPFSRAQRSLVYQRSKGQPDSRPFGTQLDVSANGYEWVNHSLQPSTLASHDFRTWIGGVPGQPHEGVAPCTQPYQASVFNISAMSFGALSANAILALNQGARTGGFAHDTGEGSISQHHRVHGGDLIWEIGSGYFGCRNADGSFSAERFTANALDPQVKMIELKLSQGAKPGHGGMLLGAKVTAEIAAARGVPEGEDCISPSSHSAFTTPLEMLQFIARLRQLSGGKPVGFKFCVVPGQPHEGVAPCTQPYQASVFNISAMSFGALSANAILALNQGARTGGFAHDTGEGSISQHHRVHGGDLIWEIGSGYFGCRNADGSFSAERFTANALDPQVKMIELKLSQGAKPGHGGMLLGAKVTAEIAAARGVPEGEDCISPSSHSAFTTPLEMLQFIARLRQLSGGKPVGFKFCVGHPWEWFAIVKAMQQTDITPDFIVVDGAEGGTGAAPVEFTDHVGVPLQEGLLLVHNTLVGVNLRHRIRLGAAGKVITAFDIARMMSLGADWCNCGRGFMMALGCIQAQTCHTGRCPTGVTTQDARRQQALVVPDKATRVANYHRQTLHALMELVQAAGLQHPRDFTPHHIVRRTGDSQVHLLSNVVLHVQPGALLGPLDGQHNVFQIYWPRACAESFHIAPPPMMPSAERPQNVPQA